MSIKKDAAAVARGDLPDLPLPFWVAVLAAWDFDHPGLPAALARSLRGLLARQPAPGLLTAFGQPVGRHAAALAARCGWRHEALTLPFRERKMLLGLAARADAAVLVAAGGSPPPSLVYAAGAARWAGVPTRWLRVD